MSTFDWGPPLNKGELEMKDAVSTAVPDDESHREINLRHWEAEYNRKGLTPQQKKTLEENHPDKDPALRLKGKEFDWGKPEFEWGDKEPTYGELFTKGIDQLGAGLTKGAAVLAQVLPGQVPGAPDQYSLNDKVSDFFNKRSEEITKSINIDKEKYEKLPFAKKLTMAAGTAAGQIALAAGTGGMAPIVMGMQGAMTSLAETAGQIEQGASDVGTEAAGTASAMIQSALNVLPFGVAKTVPGAFAAGAIAEPASSIIDKTFKKGILELTGDTKFSKDIDIFDMDDLAIGLILGGPTAAGGKFIENYRQPERLTKENRDQVLRDAFSAIEDHIKIINDNVSKQDFEPIWQRQGLPDGQEHVNVFMHDLLRDLASGQYVDTNTGEVVEPNKAIPILLDAIIQYTQVPEMKAQATWLYSLYGSPAFNDIDLLYGGLEEGTAGQYRYRRDQDSLIPEKLIESLQLSDNPRSIIRPDTVLHELNHAALLKMQRLWEGWDIGFPKNTSGSRTGFINTLPEHRRIKEMLEVFDDTFEPIKKMIDTHREEIKTFLLYNNAGRNSFDALLFKGEDNKYDIAEFLAEYSVNKDLQHAMSQVELKQSEFDAYKTNLNNPKGGKYPLTKGVQLNNHSIKSLNDAVMYRYANLMEYAMNGNRTYKYGEEHLKNWLHHAFGSKIKLEDLPPDTFAADVSNYYVRKIGQILNSSLSEQEMGLKLSGLFPSAEWQSLLNRNLPEILRNVAKWTKIHDDFNMSDDNKTRMTSDPRTIESIFKSIFKGKVPEAADDITRTGTLIFGNDQLSQIKNSSRGDKLLKAFNDKVNEYRELRSKIYNTFLAYQEPFVALGAKSRINVMEAAGHFDLPEQRARLKAQNLQWPDDAMLTQQGLTPDEITAYKSMAKGYDVMYNALDGAARALPNFGPDFKLNKIPGFMPHFHDGAVKVFMQVKFPDGSTKTILRGFDTVFGAKRYANAVIRKNDPDITLEYFDGKPFKIQSDRQTTLGITPVLVEHYKSYNNYLQLAPEMANKIAMIDAEGMRGFNKSLLARKDALGYINDPNNIYGKSMKSFMGIPNGAAGKAFTLYERYARSVADFTVNTFFEKDVVAPLKNSSNIDNQDLYGYELAKMPKLTKYIDDQGRNFTGENVNYLSALDQGLQDLAVKLQLSPHTFKFLVRGVKSFMSITKLRTPRNWYANYIQPSNGLGILQWFAYEHNLVPVNGKDSKDPFTSLAWAYQQMHTGVPDKDAQKALMWAIEQHIIAPQQDAEIGFGDISNTALRLLDKTFAGRINPAIEEFGRSVTFLTAYKYLEPMYNNKVLAMEAAARAVRLVMVNYDRSARPHIYQNTGVAGEVLSPFMVYRNAYLGNTMLMLRSVAQNPAKMQAWKPLITAQLVYLVNAGLIGGLLVGEINVLIAAYNALADDEWKFPTVEEFAMQAGLPDMLSFGVMSELTKQIPFTPEGFYAGTSASAPTATGLADMPLVPFIQAMGTLGFIPIQEAAALVSSYPGASNNDLYSSLRALSPPQLVPWIERWLANDVGAVPRAGNTEANVADSDSNFNSRTMFGAMSLEVWKDIKTEEILQKKVGRMNSYVKKYADKAADYHLGLPTGMFFNEAYSKAQQVNPQLSAAEFQDKVDQEIARRLTTKRDRDVYQGSKESRYKLELRNRINPND